MLLHSDFNRMGVAYPQISAIKGFMAAGLDQPLGFSTPGTCFAIPSAANRPKLQGKILRGKTGAVWLLGKQMSSLISENLVGCLHRE